MSWKCKRLWFSLTYIQVEAYAIMIAHPLCCFTFACSLKDVQKRTENVNTDEDPSGWRPYNSFVEILRDKYAKNEGNPGTLPLQISS